MKATPGSKALLVTALVCVSSTLLDGCKPDAALKKAEVVGKGTKPPSQPPYIAPSATVGGETASAPVGNGTVSGTIAFEGKPPTKIAIDTTMDPACSMSSANPVFTEQYVVSNGKLGNVFVYVKNGPPAALQAGPISTQPVVLDQKGCQYTPHVIGVMQGGYVEFRNSDLTMHNIHTMPTAIGNETVDVTEGPRGQAVTKQFARPELMIPVRCNNHPWMNAFVNVSATPFFAVTDASGHFSLSGLPPGDYTLGAVHEKLGEKEMQVTVAANGTAKADFSFSMK
jgi:plastocyanin